MSDAMILSHFSNDAVLEPYSVEQVPSGLNAAMKPEGLWLSDETEHGWKAWCEGEDFRTEHLEHEFHVEVDTSQLLMVRTEADMLTFNEKWTKPASFNRMMPDWMRLSKVFKGIVITPYHWRFRLDMDFFWYYGWDCASGCIWDHTAILSVTRKASNLSIGKGEASAESAGTW